MSPLFAFLGELSIIHWAIVLGVGVLLFGKRLPEVGRSLGKGIVEFKKGLKGLEDEVDVNAVARSEPMSIEPPKPPQRVATTMPKFEDAPQQMPTPPQA